MANRYRNNKTEKNNKGKRYYTTTLYPEIEPNIKDIYLITGLGDRLDILANRYYKDSSLWWVIVRANPDKIRRDGFHVKPGLQIRIPSNIQNILSQFENMNK
tara:strand:+ start:226 stop:531 length:306 start_codon:yes stop_codon:yes gene_type:complete